ncbi:CLUMA_CG019930, isoform A [Clunio marinus]|uniref:CLUMA_CG019930, isoform A n=1 Tax=Clunio marinus TaxID=568069 RepID=A0A1J1J615_9DIPT|nr:CLUMA_CG019930, isoform A [Clunio marinus]
MSCWDAEEGKLEKNVTRNSFKVKAFESSKFPKESSMLSNKETLPPFNYFETIQQLKCLC